MSLPVDAVGVQTPASPARPPDARTSAPLTLIPENIPETLRQGKRFVAWRSEVRKGQPKPAKMPYSPNATKGASSTAPGDWMPFDQAVKYAQVAYLDGIMRAFDPADGLVGVDLDNCRDPETGQLLEWAADIVKRLDTYTEVSPSGTGVKLWAYATLPPSGRKRGDVEMYDRGRFFTMTGHQLDGTPSTVGYRPDAVLAVHAGVFGSQPSETLSAPRPASSDSENETISALEIADDEVIRLASTSAHNGSRFLRLWEGDSSDYASGGNDGESEADAAFFEILAYYGGPDPEKIERIARRSNRVREKWDRQKDYLPRSIKFAIQGKTRFYGDSLQAQPATVEDGTGDPSRVRYLERALLDRDDLLELQQSIITRERSQRQGLAETIRAIGAVLALPKEHVSPAYKVLWIVSTLEMHSRASRGIATLPSCVLEEGAGLSDNMVSAGMRDLAAREGSPIQRRLTREWRTDEHGARIPVTICETVPMHQTVAETLTAICSMGGPSSREQQRREKDRERTAASWGRCSTHDNDLVAVKGYCPDCGEVVAERVMRLEDFQALNPLNPGIRETGPTAATVSVRTNGPGFRDSAPQPVSLFDYAASKRPDPSPARCPAPECRSLEFKPQPDGSWRCLKSGHDPAAYEVAAVAGGSE